MVSVPAHTAYKTTFLSMADAAKRPCGAAEASNERVINQFISTAELRCFSLPGDKPPGEKRLTWRKI